MLRRVLLAAALLAVCGPAGAEEPRAPARAGAWAAAYADARTLVEELRAEVDAMKRVREVQAEAMAWNEERAELGLWPVTLRPELCLDEENRRWCRLFPATFGVGEAGS